MFAFVFALKSEAQPILNEALELKKFDYIDKEIYLGKLYGKECVFAISGIGKVSASLTTQFIIDKFSPSHVINVGTCGGTNDSIKVLEYYLVEKACQFDFDVREIDDVELGYIQEYDSVFFPAFTDNLDFLTKTTLASADRFSSAKTDLENVNRLGCSIRDMEGGAIAQVCLSNKIKYIGIKGATDVYGHNTDAQQFKENLKTVSEGFLNVCKNLLNLL